MRKFTVILLVILMAMTAVFAGGSAEKDSDAVTLRLWTFLDITSTSNGRAVVLKEVIDKFEETHPGVDIIVETQQWTTLPSKVFAASEAGDCADIFMINTANRGEGRSRTWIPQFLRLDLMVRIIMIFLFISEDSVSCTERISLNRKVSIQNQ